MAKLALDGGAPVRPELLPYGRQSVDEDDIAAVVRVLRSDWLTTGPTVDAFQADFAARVEADCAIAVSSGTAALHAAMHALGIGRGDEVIVPPLTFAATANCVLFQGGTPVFADVAADTLLLDPARVESRINADTKAVIAVDYAGQPCDYDVLRTLAERHELALVSDACHALGGRYQDRPVGSLADLSTFSLHPVKHMTTGEGGVITTDDPNLAEKMGWFRNHGITTDHRQREERGGWFYEMIELGYNYRMTDFQCALGISQLRKLPGWVARRREIARSYDRAFAETAGARPLVTRSDVTHAYHLYVIRLELERLRVGREQVFAALRAENIGVNVHYVPVHLHPFYREHFGTGPGDCPAAEGAYEEIITLPVFPRMTDDDVDDVVAAVHKVLGAYLR